MNEEKKIVIIGAGPSGLTAAWELLKDAKNAYEVIVLERSDTVGGMAKSVIHNGNVMDVGGHRFFSKEKSVLDWWTSLFARKDSAEDLLLRQRIVSIYYREQFFDYPVMLNYKNLKKFGVKNAVQVALSYLKCRIAPRKEQTLEDFYINRFGKKLYTMFFEKYTEKMSGVRPKQIAPEWGNERVRGLSVGKIVKKHLEGKGWQTIDGLLSPSLFYYPKHGPGELWEMVAEEIAEAGGVIHLNCEVTEIHQKEDGTIGYVRVKNETGQENIQGDIFVSTMPLRELLSCMNQVPETLKNIARQLPYRSFVSMGLWVDCLRLEIPDCWIYIQEEDVKVGRIQFYRNWSPNLTKDSKKCFIAMEYFCEEGDAFWSLTEEACMEIAVQEAVQLGILSEDVQVYDWHRERIAQAYPGYYGSYKEVGKIRAYLSEVENLFCIGRNGQHRYWNMDKCMISAWDAVDHILRMR